MLKTLIYLMILSNLIIHLNSKCGEGCLSCRKKSPKEFECVVCDVHNGFNLTSKNVCKKNIIENCRLQSSDHSIKLCLKCEEGFVLDPEIEKCVQIPNSSQIEHCQSYFSFNYCEFCEESFNMIDGKCIEVEEPIEGCRAYDQENTICLSCQKNKYLKNGQCVDIVLKENCSLYTQEKCVECKDQYKFYPDYYSNSIITANIAHQYLLSEFLPSQIIPPFKETCLYQNISNCLNYSNFNTCLECETNFFVNAQGLCEENPPSKIQFCEKYSDQETCIECDQNHFLNSNVCLERTKTENCLKYETTSSTCVECESTYFLNGTNCVKRLLSVGIDYCEIYKIDLDECGECKNRFVKTTDSLACLIEIENCIRYQSPVTNSAEQLTCEECSVGFFISSNGEECLEQYVENCLTYEEGKENCKVCNDGFWLDTDQNICSFNSSLNCSELSKNSDSCEDCNEGFYLNAGQCLVYTISKCENLKSDEDKCEQCEDGYFLDEGKCHQRNNIGCSDFKEGSNDCETCLSGYYLDTEKMCIKQFTPNCVAYSFESNDCEECETGYYVKTGKCFPSNVPNCLVPNNDDHFCSVGGCEDNYSRTDEGYCVILPQNNLCTSFDAAGICNGCKDEYYLDSDNECAPNNISHCLGYDSNSNDCNQCDSDYFLDSDNNACYPQVSVGCDSFVDSSSLDCQSCLTGFFLDSNENKCVPYSVWGCATYESDENACATCNTGFVLNKTNGNCHPIQINHCATADTTTDPSTPECTTCIDGYLLNAETKTCHLKQEVAHCIDYDYTNSQCVTCAMGFFENSGACSQQGSNSFSNPDKCLLFEPNTNNCLLCESPYYIDTSFQCSVSSDCYMSEGLNSFCEYCDAGYILNSSSKICDSTGIDTTVIDTNCLGSNSSTINDCSLCKNGYQLFIPSPANTQIGHTFKNCLNYDFSTSYCLQCKANHNMNSSNECVLFEGSNQICKIKESTPITPELDDGTECQECFDYMTHYEVISSTSRTCTSRSSPVQGCGSYYYDSEKCSICDDGKAQDVNYRFYSMCVEHFSPALGSTPTKASDCDVLRYTGAISSVCEICGLGKLESGGCQVISSPDSCIIGNLIFQGSDPNQEIITLRSASSGGTSGVDKDTCVQFGDSGYGTNCLDEYKILYLVTFGITQSNFTTSTPTQRLPFIQKDGKNIYTSHLISLSLNSCISEPSFLFFGRLSNGSCNSLNTVEDMDNCSIISSLSNGSSYHLCLSCKKEFITKVFASDCLSDTSRIENDEGIVPIIQCREKNNNIFIQKYDSNHNFGFDETTLSPSEFFEADSCSNGGTVVLRLLYDTVSFEYSWFINGSSPTTGYDGAYCANSIPGIFKVDGCMIYITESNDDIDAIDDESLVYCGSCLPGYAANITDNKITSCDYIVNCDMDESVNTLPGSCKKCSDGFSHFVDKSLTMDMTKCSVLPSTLDPNCEIPIVDDTNDPTIDYFCLLCKEGYNVSQDALTCNKINLDYQDCSEFGDRTNTLFHTEDSALLSYLSSNFEEVTILFNYIYKDRVNKERIHFGCKTCQNPNATIFMANKDSMNGCFDKTGITNPNSYATNPTASFTSNCKNHHVSGNTWTHPSSDAAVTSFTTTDWSCGKCADGYALNYDDYSCNAWTTDTDIQYAAYYYVHNTAGTTITGCISGYRLDSNGDCVPLDPNCQIYGATTDSDHCKFCYSGYMTNSDGVCEHIPHEDPCSRYHDGFCVECKNEKTVIHIKENAADNSDYNKIICSQLDLDSENDMKDHIFFYEKASTAGDPGTFSSLLIEIIELDFFVGRPMSPSFFSHSCIPGHMIDNCANYLDSLFCLNCEDGYFLANEFECVKGEVKHCKKYSSLDKCEICDRGFYINSDKSECLLQSVDNCIEFIRNTNTCSKCSNEVLPADDGTCTRSKPANCLESDAPYTVCLVCESGFYLNDSGVCTMIDNENCLFSLMKSNFCRICAESYFLTDGVCTKYSVEGCRMYHQSKDLCLQCKSEYYMDSDSKCQLRENLLCAVADPHKDECLSCPSDNYFDSSSKSCNAYSVSNCLQFHPHKNECTGCPEGFALNNNKNCVLNSDSSCKKMSQYTNVCLQCEEGYYYKDNTDQCVPRSKSCRVYNPSADTCLACHDNFYLSPALTCLKHTVGNCKMMSEISNRCVSCKKDFYLNDVGDCKRNSARNCIIKNMFSNSCKLCETGYYLNELSQCQKHSVVNCSIYNNNQNTCLKCLNGFYITSLGQCQSYSVKNCFGYMENANRCANCKEGYYLFKGDCHPYTQTHCLTFSREEDSCTSCQPNSYQEGKDCHPYSVTNCLDFHKYADGCSSCHKNHYLKSKKCLEYDLPNCLTPHPRDNKCMKCVNGQFYRDANGICLKSTEVLNCNRYDDYLDECTECEKGYFMKDGKCVANPNGITNCVRYHSSEICARCISPYYLIANECVESEIIIENCVFYSHQGSCVECEKNYFLESNKCWEFENETCLEYQDRFNCKSCAPNQVLDTTQSVRKCVDSGIENCVHAVLNFSSEEDNEQTETANNNEETTTNNDETTTDNDETTNNNDNTENSDETNTDNSENESTTIVKFICKKCEPGFYLSENKCNETSTIENCADYESEEVCSKCKENFILSADKKSCVEGISNYGEGCLVAQKLSEPICAVCEEGHYLKPDNKCYQCAVAGCAICDSFNTRKCKLCKNGYQMNELFYCLESSRITQDSESFSDILEGTDFSSKMSESSYLSSILLMVLKIMLLVV